MDLAQSSGLPTGHSQDGSRIQKCRADKLCRVCGGKAISFNYNGLACESCKTFFRRNSYKPNNSFICYNDNKCEISKNNGKSCKRCRLDRCFAIGMKKELIWKSKYPEIMELMKFPEQKLKMFKSIEQKRNLCLTQCERENIAEVFLAVASFPEEKSLECLGCVQSGHEFLAYPSMYITKFIKYCKSMSSFVLLHYEDQLALVKSSFVQTVMVRFAFGYDADSNRFLSIGNEEGNKSILIDNRFLFDKKHRDPSFPVRIIKFRQTLNAAMEDDVSIRNLILAQLLFANETKSLHKPEFIRYQYHFYCALLMRYLEHKYRCMLMARQKYCILTQALSSMDYHFSKIRELYQSNSNLCKRDLVHKEIFDL